MNEYEDEKPTIIPLVIGLTRSPTLWGVPYMAVVIVIAVSIIAWLISKSFWAILTAPICYVVLFALCARDARFLDVLQVCTSKTPRTRNRTFWGANSYRS
ncbi:type IV secretion system protein VirB3 [Ochrobactrum sp. MR28]|uniref:type IV secretion system protein VirB3 n=1 Tax=Pseudochrobactrum sp. AO18b TaxID=1201036 RepID=UPI000A047A7F|nr:VirB3 family type IV secretion system protein [Pseudochrobactrum sp. AO18b]MBX8803237.1 type IV secretion system protein VirB3 [Ochrobactrum sp. MR28]MBX8818593.1 type IV secretion system protein VirB3 [Ochrobactrum sp. MR31]